MFKAGCSNVRQRTERWFGFWQSVIFTGGPMSKSARYEWRDQHAAVNECMKGFLANPNTEQLEAVVAEMRAYAAAAHNGNMEIPAKWTSYS
jgi:hypothetical protein